MAVPGAGSRGGCPSGKIAAVPVPAISVVAPCHNEAENVPELVRRLKATLEPIDPDFELVLVNNGSTDETLDRIRELGEADRRVKCVNLSRNFGHQPAVSAGLSKTSGRCVIVMDGDLQDPPEVLPELIARWRDGYEVVYAVRAKRKEGFLLRFAYASFYRVLARMSDIEIPRDSGDFALMDRRVVDIMNALPEKERFLRGLRAYVGFRQIGHVYERAARTAGESKYSLFGLMRIALNGIFSFSKKPLRIIGMTGAAVSVLSLLYMAFIITLKLTVKPDMQEGFATLVSVVLALGGLQLIAIWFLAEYIGHIFSEVKGRPSFIIRDTLNLDDEAAAPPAEDRGASRSA